MSKKSAVSKEPKITYFRPDQLIFHVNENLHGEPGKAQSLIRWANDLAKSKGIGISLSASEKVFDFKAVENPELSLFVSAQQKELPSDSGKSYKSPQAEPHPPFSLVFVNAKSEKWPESLTDEEEQESEKDWKKKAEALNELLDLAIFLDENRKDAGASGNLEGVSPNWLMSGSPSGPGSTGGPGGQPTPYNGQTNTQEYLFHFVDTLPSFRNVSMPDIADEEIVVAILDTAPKLKGEDKDKVLDMIYDKWVRNAPTGQEHSLLKTLLGPKGRLQSVYFDDDVDKPIPGVWPDGYIRAEDHDYEMTDHGLFVAGIIHSLAPQAKLHLFQVLNRYGVGDLLSIAQALQKIQNDDENFPKNRLLVNLSLTINIPLEKAHGKKDKILNKILAYTNSNKDWPKRQAQTIEWICNSLYAQGSKVIAAAGNNSKLGQARPQACYPAAFESVLGVGALPRPSDEELADSTKRVKPAKYSNRSDRPEITGITTLGGEEGEGQGVLGIYLEEFPESRNKKRKATKSTNGWGWWAGTSFATPIITGLTAAVRSFTPQANTMEAAVVELFKVQSSKTVDDEDVLDVTQGI